MNSLQGHLLVASPHFVGSPLPRAVILMVQDNEEGAAGVMLNNELNDRLLRFSRKLRHMGKSPQTALGMFQLPAPETKAEPHSPAETFEAMVDMDPNHVSDPPALPTPEAGSQPPVVPPVPVGVLVGPAAHTRDGHSPPFRVVVGAIGWPKERLEQELARGLWMSTPATPDLLFEEHEDLWRIALNRVGTNVLSSALGVAPSPYPHLN